MLLAASSVACGGTLQGLSPKKLPLDLLASQDLLEMTTRIEEPGTGADHAKGHH